MLNAKNSFIALFVGITGFIGLTAQGQQLLNQSLVPNPYSGLKTLNGYQPSILATEEDAKKIYDLMPTSIFESNSGCFERAHTWAYQLDQNHEIKSMKVFLYFTERYKREFDYEWMYHVAPLIPVKKLDGTVEEMVFDPTFTSPGISVYGADRKKFDNKPIPIKQWLKYFISPDVECPVIENFSDYFDHQDRYYCYIMKAPMYNYIPANFDQDPGVVNDPKKPKEWLQFNRQTMTRDGWTEMNLKFMKKGLRKIK